MILLSTRVTKEKKKTSALGVLLSLPIVVIWTGLWVYPSLWHANIFYGTWLTMTDSQYSFAFRRDDTVFPAFRDLLHYLRFPAHNAVIWGNPEKLEGLLKEKSIAQQQDSRGLTPLEYAIFFRQWRCAQLLLEAGASTEVRNERVSTPLWHALQTRQLKMVDLLLSHQARVDAIGNGGVTPIHQAASLGLMSVLEKMKVQQCSPNLRDAAGKTPMDYARQAESLPAVMLLADAGASVPEKVEDPNLMIRGYLMLWKATGDPQKAALAMAEETRHGFVNKIQSWYNLPAEFPVDDAPRK